MEKCLFLPRRFKITLFTAVTVILYYESVLFLLASASS